jgi:hypothetical protein
LAAKQFDLDFTVVGCQFYKEACLEMVEDPMLTENLYFRHEADNEYDPLAIAVYWMDSCGEQVKVGHVAKEDTMGFHIMYKECVGRKLLASSYKLYNARYIKEESDDDVLQYLTWFSLKGKFTYSND